ncbi:hypothetical protein VE00_03252 [Pseudogymnoascus sp. WSF 3629]|nr:hypothetical protein VE00_03252 [Pseudogymnoascus sp. WSF 3629]
MSFISMMNSGKKGGTANPPGAVSFPLLDDAAAVNAKATRELKIKVLRDVLRDELAYEHKLRKEIRKAIKEFQQERRAEQGFILLLDAPLVY